MENVKRFVQQYSFLLGLTVAFIGGTLYQSDFVTHWYGHHTHSHDTEVHYHADVVIALNGEVIDLSDGRFMSDATQQLSDYVHFHDRNDNVIHYHEEGVTLSEFLRSLGFVVADNCLTYQDIPYCDDEENEFTLYVNGAVEPAGLEYVAVDEDRLLLYHGPGEEERIIELLSSVTDEACIYSLTCPERGTPPPESCGLSCEM